MRVWDLPVTALCDDHLRGEHRELHGIWNIITLDKRGYRNHPETQRWIGRLGALRRRHEEQVEEMGRRGWNHKSPLPAAPAGESEVQDTLVDSLDDQRLRLIDKGCACEVKHELAP